MNLYKCTLKSGKSVHAFSDPQGLTSWPLPKKNPDGSWTPGAWKGPDGGTIKPHHKGLHLTTEHMLIFWLREEVYRAEIGAEFILSKDCLVAREARLLRPLQLPAEAWADLALTFARKAREVFEALVYPWDVVKRLDYALEIAHKRHDMRHAHLSFQSLPNADAYWKLMDEVVKLCEVDMFSGFETNVNVEAAGYAAQTIALLKDLTYPDDGRDVHNWEVVKNQAARLVRAMSYLVDDLMLNHGMGFSVDLVPDVAQPFLVTQETFPRLHHAVRYNTAQWCNNHLLAKYRAYGQL